MRDAADPQCNRLLAGLEPEEWQRCLPRLERVDLQAGQMLFAASEQVGHMYFPTSATLSLQCLSSDGATLEVAQVGREGAAGVSLFLGGRTTTSAVLVEHPGAAFRLPAALLQAEFDRGGSAMHLFLRFTQALITQVAQIAVCTRHHHVDQQLCRWLLTSHDRLPGAELPMTQELIAQRLGVRRESVAEAAHGMQAAGLIEYRRGRIRVLDRAGLENRSCECYRMIRTEYERLLPAEQPPLPAGGVGPALARPTARDGWPAPPRPAVARREPADLATPLR